MRSKLQWASGIAVAATMLIALFGATGSGAFAEEKIPAIVPEKVETRFVSEPVVQDPEQVEAEETASTPQTDFADTEGQAAMSLAALVDSQPEQSDLDADMKCLAGAIYFEARGESLDGQLAVGRVIVERAKSGRFPSTYCGVVLQRSQFSFVRGGRMPTVRRSSSAWRRAVAVARIADEGIWDSPTEGALFFHAKRVSPGWRLKRLAQVDNHIFYR